MKFQGTVCQQRRTEALLACYQTRFKLMYWQVEKIVDNLYNPDHLSAYHYKVVNKYTGETVECDDGAQALEVMHDMAVDNSNAPFEKFIWGIAPAAVIYHEGVEVAFAAYNEETDNILTKHPLYESFHLYAKYDC